MFKPFSLILLLFLISNSMTAQNASDAKTIGWDAIDKACENIYDSLKPQHFAPKVYYSQGGDQPLDGISVYKDEKNCCNPSRLFTLH